MSRSFKRTNERRIELIRKQLHEGLSAKEERELARAEQFVDRWVNERYPLPKLEWFRQQVEEVNHARS